MLCSCRRAPKAAAEAGPEGLRRGGSSELASPTEPSTNQHALVKAGTDSEGPRSSTTPAPFPPASALKPSSTFHRRAVQRAPFRAVTFAAILASGPRKRGKSSGSQGGSFDDSELFSRESRFEREWRLTDVDRDERLTRSEIRALLIRLNVPPMSEATLSAALAAYDADGSGDLSKQEFKQFFAHLQSFPTVAGVLASHFAGARPAQPRSEEDSPQPATSSPALGSSRGSLLPGVLRSGVSSSSSNSSTGSVRARLSARLGLSGRASSTLASDASSISSRSKQDAFHRRGVFRQTGTRLTPEDLCTLLRWGATDEELTERAAALEASQGESPSEAAPSPAFTPEELRRAERLVALYEHAAFDDGGEEVVDDTFQTLSVLGLSRLLGDPVANCAWEVASEDMTQPLSQYFINSSHNTYLGGNQFMGVASPAAVASALVRGVRVVELDVYDFVDASNKQSAVSRPYVYHKNSLVVPTPLEEFVSAIEEYAFKASPYPVILTLENHCRANGQKMIREILTRVLGSKLFLWNGEDLPKPSEAPDAPVTLAEASSIMKQARLDGAAPPIAVPNPASNGPSTAGEGRGAELNSAASELLLTQEQKAVLLTHAVEAPTEPLIRMSSSPEEEEEEESGEDDWMLDETRTDEADPDAAPLASGFQVKDPPRAALASNSATSEKRVPGPPQWLSPQDMMGKILIRDKVASRCEEYAGVVTIPNVKLKHKMLTKNPRDGLLDFPVRESATSSSLDEIKLFQLSKLVSPAKVHEYTRRHLLRSYPKGKRIDSSNYDPSFMWANGVQIAALNVQSNDLPNLINRGRFLYQTKNAGYVLKPAYMRSPTAKPAAPVKLKVHVISGHSLPKPQNRSEESEIIDPYVSVSIRGSFDDPQAQRTECVKDNGHDPHWRDGKFEFNVQYPELAIVTVVVYDKEILSSDAIVAEAAFPLSLLRPGYRAVPLTFPDGRPSPFAYLFARFVLVPL